MNDARLVKLLAQKVEAKVFKKIGDASFAKSLTDQWTEKAKLSPKQWFWVRVMLLRAGVEAGLIGAGNDHILAAGKIPSKEAAKIPSAEKFTGMHLGSIPSLWGVVERAYTLNDGSDYVGVRLASPVGVLLLSKTSGVMGAISVTVDGQDLPLATVQANGYLVPTHAHGEFDADFWDMISVILTAAEEDPRLFLAEAGRKYGVCSFCGKPLTLLSEDGLHLTCKSFMEA